MIPRKFYSFVGNCGGQKLLNDIRPVTSPALATVDYSHLHSFHSGYQKMNFHSLLGQNLNLGTWNTQEVDFENNSLKI